ncbi:hypothetical protein [Vibrio paucivorans]|uniref:Uncharacterized protein n=1 Tax=Vibrio paucivorans TaxID=2829489 RepID=A0A9X3CGG8_9VIBR|nr:hypothetical protein [Vibrio paucivorans]MCW8335419.1 hypothetical protein [Vibrio paucivorans]
MPGFVKYKKPPKEDYRNKNHPIEYYYFKSVSLERKCSNFKPDIISINLNNIFILNEDVDKISSFHQIPLISEIPENSPYYIPERYQNHSSLCKLASIGFGIFELKTIPKPKTVRDGGLLLEKYNLFERKDRHQKQPLKPSKKAESGYAFINMEFGKGRGKCKVQTQNPQIQHLFPSPDEGDGLSKVKSKIESLDYSDDMTDFAIELMSKKI